MVRDSLNVEISEKSSEFVEKKKKSNQAKCNTVF